MKKRRGHTIEMKCCGCENMFQAFLIKVRQGKGKYCSIECYQAYRKKNKKDEKERAKIHQKKYNYNLSENEYYGLFEKQNYQCAICQCDLNTNRPCVDHDHETNSVRGILCNACNRGLGFFKDDVDRLRNAIKYLGLV
jgi:hypothetical protein